MIPCVPIFRQNEQLWVLGPKFTQKWILGSKFQKSKSGFGINILEIPCTPIFRQNGQLWIFGPKFAQKWILGLEIWSKFGKIAQLRAIFWFKYCWGCCRELGGGWNELGGGGLSWVELGGGRWSWVELGARFSNTQRFSVFYNVTRFHD